MAYNYVSEAREKWEEARDTANDLQREVEDLDDRINRDGFSYTNSMFSTDTKKHSDLYDRTEEWKVALSRKKDKLKAARKHEDWTLGVYEKAVRDEERFEEEAAADAAERARERSDRAATKQQAKAERYAGRYATQTAEEADAYIGASTVSLEQLRREEEAERLDNERVAAFGRAVLATAASGSRIWAGPSASDYYAVSSPKLRDPMNSMLGMLYEQTPTGRIERENSLKRDEVLYQAQKEGFAANSTRGERARIVAYLGAVVGFFGVALLPFSFVLVTVPVLSLLAGAAALLVTRGSHMYKPFKLGVSAFWKCGGLIGSTLGIGAHFAYPYADNFSDAPFWVTFLIIASAVAAYFIWRVQSDMRNRWLNTHVNVGPAPEPYAPRGLSQVSPESANKAVKLFLTNPSALLER